MGVGMEPNVSLAKNSLNLSSNGGIETDVFLQSSHKGVYAAGDIASYPYWYTGERVRTEHYNDAI